MIFDYLAHHQDRPDCFQYAMVGYHLRSTVTEHGSVARGVCPRQSIVLCTFRPHIPAALPHRSSGYSPASVFSRRAWTTTTCAAPSPSTAAWPGGCAASAPTGCWRRSWSAPRSRRGHVVPPGQVRHVLEGVAHLHAPAGPGAHRLPEIRLQFLGTLDEAGERILRAAFERMGLTARSRRTPA